MGCQAHRLHHVYTCAHPTPSFPPPCGGRGVGARWATLQPETAFYSRSRSSTNESSGHTRRRRCGCQAHRLHQVYKCAHPTPSSPPPRGGRGVGARWATLKPRTSFCSKSRSCINSQPVRQEEDDVDAKPTASITSTRVPTPPRPPLPPVGAGGWEQGGQHYNRRHHFTVDRAFLQPSQSFSKEDDIAATPIASITFTSVPTPPHPSFPPPLPTPTKCHIKLKTRKKPAEAYLYTYT